MPMPKTIRLPLSWCDMDNEINIEPGIYRHYKGNDYEVLTMATHTETLERVVVYKALYGEGKMWVRPASMWNETVAVGDKTVKRFTKIR